MLKIIGTITGYLMLITIFLNTVFIMRAILGKKLKSCCFLCKFYDEKLFFCLRKKRDVEKPFDHSCPLMIINNKLLKRGGRIGKN